MEDYDTFVQDQVHFCERLDALTQARGKAMIQRWKDTVMAGDTPEVVRELLTLHYDPVYVQSMERNFVQYTQAQCVAPGPHRRSHERPGRSSCWLLRPRLRQRHPATEPPSSRHASLHARVAAPRRASRSPRRGQGQRDGAAGSAGPRPPSRRVAHHHLHAGNGCRNSICIVIQNHGNRNHGRGKTTAANTPPTKQIGNDELPVVGVENCLHDSSGRRQPGVEKTANTTNDARPTAVPAPETPAPATPCYVAESASKAKSPASVPLAHACDGD